VIRPRLRGAVADAVREQAAEEGCSYGDVIAGWRTGLAEALVREEGQAHELRRLATRLSWAEAQRDSARRDHEETHRDLVAEQEAEAEARVTAAGLRSRLDEAIAERDAARLEAMALTSRLASVEEERDAKDRRVSRMLAEAEHAGVRLGRDLESAQGALFFWLPFFLSLVAGNIAWLVWHVWRLSQYGVWG
jgi:chromosome segregation ATPase